MSDLDIRFSSKGEEQNKKKDKTENVEDLNFSLNEKGEHIPVYSDNDEAEEYDGENEEYDGEYELYWEDDPADNAYDAEDEESEQALTGYERHEASLNNDIENILEEYSEKTEESTPPEQESKENPSEEETSSPVEELADSIVSDIAKEINEQEKQEEYENKETDVENDENGENKTGYIPPEFLDIFEPFEPSDDELTEEELAEKKAVRPYIEAAKTEERTPSLTDNTLTRMAKDMNTAKYDFVNLGVIGFIILFIGITFIFMNGSAADAEGEKLSFETIKTGEYTASISEKYTSDMPLESIMENANVIIKKIFGKSDLEFKKKVPSSMPNGPVEFEGGNMEVDNSDDVVTSSTETTTTANATTTEKIPQNFSVSKVEDDGGDDGLFTGRPIQTTTTTVTTELELPEGTESTTTGKVELIFPE